MSRAVTYRSVLKDGAIAEGISLLVAAAKKGEARAMKELGEIYLFDPEIRNYDLAYQWTYLASKQKQWIEFLDGGRLAAFDTLDKVVPAQHAKELQANAEKLLER